MASTQRRSSLGDYKWCDDLDDIINGHSPHQSQSTKAEEPPKQVEKRTKRRYSTGVASSTFVHTTMTCSQRKFSLTGGVSYNWDDDLDDVLGYFETEPATFGNSVSEDMSVAYSRDEDEADDDEEDMIGNDGNNVGHIAYIGHDGYYCADMPSKQDLGYGDSSHEQRDHQAAQLPTSDDLGYGDANLDLGCSHDNLKNEVSQTEELPIRRRGSVTKYSLTSHTTNEISQSSYDDSCLYSNEDNNEIEPDLTNSCYSSSGDLSCDDEDQDDDHAGDRAGEETETSEGSKIKEGKKSRRHRFQKKSQKVLGKIKRAMAIGH